MYLVDLALDEANESTYSCLTALCCTCTVFCVGRNCRSGYSGRARVPGGLGPGRGEQREHGR